MAKKQADVSTPSWAYGVMSPRWDIINTVMGGTEAMRAAGEAFLPRYERERPAHWQRRVDRAVLLNMLEKTSDHLVGQALKRPPELDVDVPPEIVALMEDVDGQGTGLATFARMFFKQALDKAFCHVLVDFPAAAPRPDGRPRTLEDDRRDGLRPYWLLIPPENLIFAHAEFINGKETLTHIRFREDEVVVDGWEEVCKQRIRVIRRVPVDSPGGPTHVIEWSLWELQKVRGKKEEWVEVDGGIMDIDEIPLVTFYTARDALCLGKPPLLDLAYLNICHWQSSSDQRNVLTVTRFPMLAISGALKENPDGSAPISVGPHSYLQMDDPQGKFYFVEHTGAAISAGRQDLEDLKEEMASYGAEFMKKRPANEGVVARALDSAESLSALQVWVIDFRDALERALRLTAKWLRLGDDAGGSVLLDHTGVGLTDTETAHLDALDKARARRDISRVAYLAELKRRRVLSEDFDAEEDAEELEREAPSPEVAGMVGLEGLGGAAAAGGVS